MFLIIVKQKFVAATLAVAIFFEKSPSKLKHVSATLAVANPTHVNVLYTNKANTSNFLFYNLLDPVNVFFMYNNFTALETWYFAKNFKNSKITNNL